MKNKSATLTSFLAVLLSACGIAPPTETPIPTIPAIGETGKSDTLIVMLPGRGDRANSFVDAGFLEAAGASDFDVLAVDAHFGYYMKRSLMPRLHDDVIRPAKAAGYEEIWMLGVSMGGLGSLLYAAEHPENVDGVVLLAPYLGDPELAGEIQAAGGLQSWDPGNSEFKDHEVAIWEWLKTSRAKDKPVPVILGYGRNDKFAGFYAPLQDNVGGITVYEQDGAHNWSTWSELWRAIQADLE